MIDTRLRCFNRTIACVAMAALACSLAGCDRVDDPPAPQQVETEYNAERETSYQSPPADADDARYAEFVGLRAPIPATWSERPPQSPMHRAMFIVPGKNGAEEAQIVVFYFGPGQGGSVEANLDRWKNQFRTADGEEVEPSVRTFEANELSVTLFEVEGSYMALGATAWAHDQHMIAAIVDTPPPTGRRIFIRFVGDSATVRTNRDAFVSMIEAMRWIGE